MIWRGKRATVLATLTLGLAACTAAAPQPDPPSPATEPAPAAPTATTAPGRSEQPSGAPDLRGLHFSNQTDAAGVTFVHATPFDAENYTSAMDTAKMRGGATAGDFNNDGWVDLFVIGGGLRADALFINQGDGTFVDRAEAAGVAGELHLGSSATVGDYDGDGWLDLFVAGHGPPSDPQPGHHRLFHNNGDGTFTDVAAEAGVGWTSREVADGFGAVFGDYDVDGDLDLFVAGWAKDSFGNRLFRNNGDGTFDDVTEQAGVVDDGIRGFSPCLVDTDGDRYPELLLVADFGTSRYFRNLGDGTFEPFTTQAGVGREWSGMGTAVGDFDNSGTLDWYVTAIFDDAAQGRGDGNKLYYNRGSHRFEEAAQEAGVDDGGWGWGAVAVDLDHDGWQDIVETNGWHFPDFEVYTDELAKVWVNQGDGTFTEVAEASGLDHDLMGLALLTLDYDNDGDQDLALSAANDEFRLYRNDLAGGATHWLRVFLDTAADPGLAPGGIGSLVWVTAGDRTYLRHVGGCANYLSHSELSAHFGVGAAEVIDEVRVEWTDGTVTVVEDVVANQTLTVAAP